MLTAYLRSDINEDTSYAAARDTTIQTSAATFSAAFATWAKPRQTERDRVQNLVEIMRNAAQVGILIFSQASDFEYIWSAASDGRSHSRTQSRSRDNRAVVVTPGFVKVTDEKARPLASGQVIVPPVVVDV